MVEFARYYVDFVRELFFKYRQIFQKIFEAFADLLFNDVVKYFNKLIAASDNFGLLDWLIAIVVIGINVIFFIFVLIKGYQFLRHYIRFAKSELDKDELLEEISLLSQKTVELADEKNKILQLKMGRWLWFWQPRELYG